MIKIYYSSVENLDLNKDYVISNYRKEKITRLRREEDKKLSLGAEFLLNFALNEEGVKIPAIYQVNENGKPFIKEFPFFFNLSHSKNIAVCAVSESEIGVDIQFMNKASFNIAKRFFCYKDFRYILKCETPHDRFYEYWTLKESYIKAVGKGLSLPLNSFLIEFDNGIPTIKNSLYSFYLTEIEEVYKLAVCVLGNIKSNEVEIYKVQM